MKIKYEKPSIEIVTFESQDIITTSADGFNPDIQLDNEGLNVGNY